MNKKNQEEEFTLKDWLRVLGVSITIGAGMSIGILIIQAVVLYLKT